MLFVIFGSKVAVRLEIMTFKFVIAKTFAATRTIRSLWHQSGPRGDPRVDPAVTPCWLHGETAAPPNGISTTSTHQNQNVTSEKHRTNICFSGRNVTSGFNWGFPLWRKPNYPQNAQLMNYSNHKAMFVTWRAKGGNCQQIITPLFLLRQVHRTRNSV